MNVLIVDDELDYRLILGRLLSERGSTVFLAENGRDGILKLKVAHMDLIITDVYMPVMDGFAMHGAVRQISGYESVPILFVSAYEDDPSHRATRNPKRDAFHRKERPVEELLAWIDYLTGVRTVKPAQRPTRVRSPQPVVSPA
jgi:CheY-like chemotaxis protein